MGQGIAVKVFSELDMAAIAAAVLQMKNIWGKGGKDISAGLVTDLKAAQDDMVRSINAAARAEIDAAKATAEQKLAIRKANNAAMVEEDKRTLAQQRAIMMAPIADMRKEHADKQYANATKNRADAEEAHAAALEKSAAAAGGYAAAFNKVGMVTAGALGLIGGASIKAASDYEAGLTRIQSATDMTAGNISQLQTGLLQLSTQMGVSMDELQQAAYQTSKSGGMFRDAAVDLNFLRDAIKLAKIDAVPLQDVIQGGTTSINDFNVSADRMVDILARLKTAAGDIKTGNIGDLSRALDNLEPRTAAGTLSPNMSMDQRLSQYSQMLTVIQRLTSAGANPDVATQWANNALGHIVKPTGPQAQFLGGILHNIGMAPSDLMEGLTDPNKGQLWAFETIQRAIDASKDASGNVTIPVRQMNQDILAKLGVARNSLTSPQEKAIADRLIADAESGTIPDKSTFIAARLASKLPDFKGFMTVFNNAAGYSASMTNRSTPMSVPYAYALNTALGTDAGSTLGQQLFGTPQNAALTRAEQERMQGSSKADLDQSFALVQSTAAWKLADTKAQMHALSVVIGQELMPSFKQFLDVLRDVFSFLANHKGVLDAFLHTLEIMSAVWAGNKILGAINKMNEAIGLVTAKTLLMNTTMEATGLAAQKGAAGVAAAGVEEIGVLARVRGAALTLGATLAAAAANLAIVGTGIALLNLHGSAANPNIGPGGDERQAKLEASKGYAQKFGYDKMPKGYAQWLDGTGPMPPEMAPFYKTPADLKGGRGSWDANAPGGVGDFFGNKQRTAAAAPNLQAGIPDFGQEPFPDVGGAGSGKKGKREPLPGITSPDQIVMPAGTADDPLYVAPGGEGGDSWGRNPWDTRVGPRGDVVNNPMEKFTRPSGLWGKNGVLGSVAGMMASFLAELALGNPLGHLMNMPNSQYAWWYQGEGKGGMFGKAEQASNRLANAFDRVNEALARGYGPGTPQYDIAARNYQDAQISAGRYGITEPGQAPSGMVGGGGSAPITGGKVGPAGYTQDQAATAIIQAAQARGLNREQTLAALSVGLLETGLGANGMTNAAQNQNGTVVQGLFQQDSGYNKYFGGGPRTDPRGAANGFVDQFIARGGMNKDPYQGAVDVQVGQYGPGYVRSFRPQAEQFYNRDSYWGNVPGGGGQGGPGLLPGQAPDFFGAGGGGLPFPLSPGGGSKWGKGNPGWNSSWFGSSNLQRGGTPNSSIGGFDTGASKPGFGLPMLQEMGSAAGMGMDMFAPGSGAIMQLAMQEANRGAQALGEAAATMVGEFPLETFFLSGKDLSGKNVDMSKSFLGKIAGGLMGAHTNTPNSAGGAEGDAMKMKNPNDPMSTNPAQAKNADAKTGGGKDPGSNNNYGVQMGDVHMHSGENSDDLTKAINRGFMMAPGGPQMTR